MNRNVLILVIGLVIAILLMFVILQTRMLTRNGQEGIIENPEGVTPTLTDSPTQVPTSVSEISPRVNTPTPRTQTVKIFLVALEDNGKSGKKIGCGDSLVPVNRQIQPTQAVLRTALEELFSIKQQFYGQSGLYNSLYNSNLRVDSATVENGKATVRLSGTVSLGGVCDNPRFEEQIRATVLQFPTVSSADIFINGKPIDQVVSGRGE